MQAYPGYGYKQECFVYVEEDNFNKDDFLYGNASSEQTERPRRYIPAPPQYHHAPPSRGSYDDPKHGKESYWTNDNDQHQELSWKPNYGGKKHDGGGYKHKYTDGKKHDGGYKYEYEDGKKHDGGGYKHEYADGKKHNGGGYKFEYADGKKHDGGGGYKYEYADDIKTGDCGGNEYQGPNQPVKHYRNDREPRPIYYEHKEDVYWNSKGIDD